MQRKGLAAVGGLDHATHCAGRPILSGRTAASGLSPRPAASGAAAGSWLLDETDQRRSIAAGQKRVLPALMGPIISRARRANHCGKPITPVGRAPRKEVRIGERVVTSLAALIKKG